MEDLSMKDWISYVWNKAIEYKCICFDSSEIIGVSLDVDVELFCTEKNVVKLLQLAKENAVPIIFEEKFYYKFELYEATIKPEELRKNHNYLYASFKDREKIKQIVEEHNNSIINLPQQECYMVSIFVTLLSGVTIGINIEHSNYDEWYDLLNKDMQMNRILKLVIGEFKDKEELIEKRSEMRDSILEKFRDYLINHKEFKLCTNKESRRNFLSKYWNDFRHNFCNEEEKECTEDNILIPTFVLVDSIEIAWRFLKTESKK